MIEDEKSQVERLKDNYEQFFKGTNYLLVGHGAGLLACLAALKDYATAPQLKGIGSLIELFGTGMLAAVVTYVCLIFVRTEVLRAAAYRLGPSRYVSGGLGLVAPAAALCSVGLFTAALVIVMNHLSAL
jgi:hypothetical protein